MLDVAVSEEFDSRKRVYLRNKVYRTYRWILRKLSEDRKRWNSPLATSLSACETLNTPDTEKVHFSAGNRVISVESRTLVELVVRKPMHGRDEAVIKTLVQ
ncbi:hypothetical protein N7470_006641 [Penicillium chermesinum]|nr:hypothetical protein N7470_006641 [Penicillium chermesinum]